MMESSVSLGMCRCCASEGAFKDIKSTYHWMGEEEIYADMLRECFDIILNASDQGQDGGICEVCITQLRNAINFKKQVLHTEDQFQKHLQNKTLFRPHLVKVEVQGDEDSDDNMGSGDEGFSGAEFEVPIKTEVDDPKPKKRAAAKASATTTRASAKKAKADNGETSTKRRSEAADLAKKILSEMKERQVASKTETAHTKSKVVEKKIPNKDILQSKTDEEKKSRKMKKKSQKQNEEELFKQRYNIREILLCSNATPIRKYDIGYVCCFCQKQYPNAEELKTHTITEHDDSDKLDFMKGQPTLYFLVKLDITALKCTLCDTGIDSVADLIQHLRNEHGKPMFTEIKNYIIPFKFEDSTLKCTFCPRICNRFKVLQEHMYTHYRNFVCDVCGTGFVNEKMLNTHHDSHKVGVFKCGHCPEEFNTPRKKQYHEKTVHLLSLNKCGYCDEKFMWYRQKCAHIAKVHGIVVTQPKECKACDKVFPSDSKLQLHVRRDHLLERRFKCTECDMEFFSKESLNDHMVKHTGIKRFSCKVCCKSYGLKKALREHIRMHENDRRFKCETCDQAFLQKCSWKTHMRSKHGITV